MTRSAFFLFLLSFGCESPEGQTLQQALAEYEVAKVARDPATLCVAAGTVKAAAIQAKDAAATAKWSQIEKRDCAAAGL
jgi:hypothetical protein